MHFGFRSTYMCKQNLSKEIILVSVLNFISGLLFNNKKFAWIEEEKKNEKRWKKGWNLGVSELDSTCLRGCLIAILVGTDRNKCCLENAEIAEIVHLNKGFG